MRAIASHTRHGLPMQLAIPPSPLRRLHRFPTSPPPPGLRLLLLWERVRAANGGSSKWAPYLEDIIADEDLVEEKKADPADVAGREQIEKKAVDASDADEYTGSGGADKEGGEEDMDEKKDGPPLSVFISRARLSLMREFTFKALFAAFPHIFPPHHFHIRSFAAVSQIVNTRSFRVPSRSAHADSWLAVVPIADCFNHRLQTGWWRYDEGFIEDEEESEGEGMGDGKGAVAGGAGESDGEGDGRKDSKPSTTPPSSSFSSSTSSPSDPSPPSAPASYASTTHQHASPTYLAPGFFEIVAGEESRPGDQVFLSYGQKGNDVFFLKYGFVQEDNYDDKAYVIESETEIDK